MGRVFSEVVAAEAWRVEVLDWLARRLGEVDVAITGPVEQPRIRPWSTQLVVPTDAGRMWFKANCPGLAHEPAVHGALAGLVPAEVDAPVAVDAQRGWMLTADRGATLGDSREPTLEDWQAVVGLAATVQREVAESRGTLLGVGLPDCAPATVPARYLAMVDALAALPSGHPSHLGSDEAGGLRDGVGVVESAVATLSAGPLPATLQHGDLHPRNVFAVGGGLRIFDFGDAQWAHALEVLAVPYGFTTRYTSYPWDEVLDAYAAQWADLVGREELAALMRPAMVTQAVNRAALWLSAIEGAQEHELDEWGDSPLHYLRLVHAPFPPDDPEDGP